MKHKYLENVATISLSTEKCIGCGRCTEVCPHGVFILNERKVRLKDKNRCMECGACAVNCPTDAITVDAGVGCAYAVIKGWLTGTQPSCDCSDSTDCC